MTAFPPAIDIDLDTRMRSDFLNYAMSVITDRALPDVRDGLKPVHRRILYAMREMGLVPEKPTQKSAGVVGEVLKNYHPHGDTSVYDAAVRMAQDWSLLHPLIQGQGNFGSREGDGPAAYRYTEMKLARIAMQLFADIDKETVDMRLNFDGRVHEPTILPAAFPNILVNGTDGIAVAMATYIPPHNLREVANAVFAYLDNPAISPRDIAKIMTGPDFPTGGIVHDIDGYVTALETGRGTMKLRATWHAEETKRHTLLVIDSIPYQGNIATICERMGEIINPKDNTTLIDDVTDFRNESSRTIRIVVELRKNSQPELAFNKFLALRVGLETSIPYNAVVLDNNVPKQLGVVDIIAKWVAFRIHTIRRAGEYDLRKARERLHILEAFIKAINRLDEVIAFIRASADGPSAKTGLMSLLDIDEIQSQAILDMKLQKLTGLELNATKDEHTKIAGVVAHLEVFVTDEAQQVATLRADLEKIATTYGRDRQTEVQHSLSRLTREDLTERQDVVVIITKAGYVKRIPASEVTKQNRGTRGRSWMNVGDDDAVEAIHSGSTHDYLLAVTTSGKVHAKKVFQIDEGKPGTKGRHVSNVLEGMAADDRIVRMLTIPEFSEDLFIVTVSIHGQIKRTPLSDLSGSTRSTGMNLLSINDDDALAAVDVCREYDHILIVGSNGRCVRFIADHQQMRPMGRNAAGSRAIRLPDNERVVGMIVLHGDGTPQTTTTRTITEDDGSTSEIQDLDTTTMDADTYLLTVGAYGVGKKTRVSEFTAHARGTKGVTCFNINGKTGPLVRALRVSDDLDIIMVSGKGVTNRITTTDVRCTNRVASGSRLITLDKGDALAEISTVVRDVESLPDSEPSSI